MTLTDEQLAEHDASYGDLIAEVKRLRLDADVLLHQTTAQMLNAARDQRDKLAQALKAVMPHAEEMLKDEFKTDDLSDWPWVLDARSALESLTTERPVPMQWQCNICGLTVSLTHLSAPAHCARAGCRGLFVQVEVDSDE